MMLVVDDLRHPGTVTVESRPERSNLALGSVTSAVVMLKSRVKSASSAEVLRMGHHGAGSEKLFFVKRLAEILVEQRVRALEIVEPTGEERSEAVVRHL